MKIIISSDIHINDFRLYNVTPKNRLNEFNDVLIDKFREVKEKYDAKYLFLAGDLIDKPTNRPYVVNAIGDFYRSLCKIFDEVYYILGQHEQDQKSIDLRPQDNILTTLSRTITNFKYVHDQYLEFDGRSVYFSDFSFKKEVITPKRHVDLHVSHVTLDTEWFQGQTLDDSNFDLGLYGDIHMHIDRGKIHSIGTPTQIGRRETQTHTLGVWDTEDNSFFREYINNDNRLQRIEEVNDRDKAGPDIENNIYYYFKDRSVKVDVGKTQVVLDSDLNIRDMITKVMSEFNLIDIHSEVVNKSDYSPIDFNFRPIELEVSNVRSCKYFKYEFQEGITYINGLVGSGKSTVINSILDTLDGRINLKDRVTWGESEAFTSLVLEYQGHIYKIIRHSHKTDEFFVDNVPIQGNSASVIKNEIRETLPFIDYLDSFFFGSWMTEILGNLKINRRVELLSKYYQLDITDSYTNIARVTLDTLNRDLKSLNESHLKVQSKIELVSQDLIDPGYNLEDLVKERIELEKIIFEIEDNMKLRDLHKNLSNQIDTKSNLLSIYEDKISQYTELVPKRLEISNEVSVLKSKSEKYYEINSDLKQKNRELSSLQSQLFNVENEVVKEICPTCNQPLDPNSVRKVKEVKDKRISDMKKSINLLEDEIRNLNNDLKVFNNVNTDLQNKVSELSSMSNKVSELPELQLSSTKLRKEIEDLTKKRDGIVVKDTEVDIKSVYDKIKITSNKLSEQKKYLSDMKSIEEFENIKLDIETRLENVKSDVDRYSQYVSLLQFNGPIVTQLLEKLAEKFKDETFRFKTLGYKKNGSSYTDLTVEYFNGSHWVTYDECSTGQRVLCDTYFLSKLITYSGMVMFDEFFSRVDDYTVDSVYEIVRSINSKYILICSHSSNVTDIDHKISVELDSTGVSNYKIS